MEPSENLRVNVRSIDLIMPTQEPAKYKNKNEKFLCHIRVYKNCFNLPREKKSGDREHFFRLLELYIQTVKGENNYETKYFLNTLLEVIRYTLEQLKNQLKP